MSYWWVSPEVSVHKKSCTWVNTGFCISVTVCDLMDGNLFWALISYCQFQTDLQEKQISLVMDILILNNCSNCFKEEWTTLTSPYYLCSECCVLKCPECQETEVMFVVNLQNERRGTKILMCLNVDCLYSEDGPDADRSNEYHYSRRWSLKQKNCVSRKLSFDLWVFFLYHKTNSSWGIETLFHLSLSLCLS